MLSAISIEARSPPRRIFAWPCSVASGALINAASTNATFRGSRTSNSVWNSRGVRAPRSTSTEPGCSPPATAFSAVAYEEPAERLGVFDGGKHDRASHGDGRLARRLEHLAVGDRRGAGERSVHDTEAATGDALGDCHAEFVIADNADRPIVQSVTHCVVPHR